MANIASATAMYIQAVVATGLAAGAKASPTVFTCKSDDQLDSHEGAPWIVSSSYLITVVALMVVSAILGRWSAPRSAGKEAVRDPEPWLVISEDSTLPEPEQGKMGGRSASERPIEAEGEGSRVPSECPKGGDQRTQAPRGLGSVREVASQAPCTYTILRGNARGRFQVLPDAAHG